MHIELHSAGRKLLYGLLCLGLIAGYVFRAGRGYLVSRALSSTDPDVLERAVRWEPNNAEAWYRLGRVRFVLLQDIPASIAPVQRAIALDPRHARYWLDLALAYEYTGDTTAQRKAIENAVRAGSHDPDIAWEAANFYLVAGDTDHALPLFRATLEGDGTGKRIGQAVLLSLRATNNDFARVLDEVLPRNPDYYVDFANLAVQTSRFDAADLIWSRMVAMGIRVHLPTTESYFQSLIRRNESERARAAWNDLAKVNPELGPYSYSDGNLIVNGRFENNILNAGFDWHYTRNDAAPLEIDNTGAHGGSHALLMTFTAQPVGDLGLRQTIPVNGGECYEFSAFLRASDLEGVSGPRFWLRDTRTERSYVVTETMTGTHGWEQQRKTFRTDPNTHFLDLSIVRERPETIIRGRAWADDIRLTRVTPEACR